jgi:hypothetical protein
MLLHDTTLVFGKEVTKGVILPPPDKAAQVVFKPVLMSARYAAGLEEKNITDFELPDEPSRKLRKLGRLAVLGGAHLLMAKNVSSRIKAPKFFLHY